MALPEDIGKEKDDRENGNEYDRYSGNDVLNFSVDVFSHDGSSVHENDHERKNDGTRTPARCCVTRISFISDIPGMRIREPATISMKV